MRIVRTSIGAVNGMITGMAAAEARSAMSPGRVAVQDVSSTVTMLICSLLRRWGYEAIAGLPVSGGSHGATFDLLIADPATRESVLASEHRHVPWLALVSDGRSGGADAAGWVHKPVDPEALLAAVRRCLDVASTVPADGIDVAAIAECWGSVFDIGFGRVARAFLSEMEQVLPDLSGALVRQDRRALQIGAHSVVGAAANVGAVALAAAARALEAAAPHAGPESLSRLLEQVSDIARRDLPLLGALIGKGRDSA